MLSSLKDAFMRLIPKNDMGKQYGEFTKMPCLENLPSTELSFDVKKKIKQLSLEELRIHKSQMLSEIKSYDKPSIVVVLVSFILGALLPIAISAEIHLFLEAFIAVSMFLVLISLSAYLPDLRKLYLFYEIICQVEEEKS